MRALLLFLTVLGLTACASRQPGRDPSSLLMTFEQRECLGPCPIYSITIRGDGTATYTGMKYVTVQGEHHYRIEPEEVDAMLQAFDRVGFQNLKDWYPALGTDLPSEFYKLQRDGAVKTVLNEGREATLRPVYEAFDRHGRGEQWARGNAQTVPALKDEGFDFRSHEAGAVFTRAAILGSPEAVQSLLRQHVPLNVSTEFLRQYECRQWHEATARMLKRVGASAGSCY